MRNHKIIVVTDSTAYIPEQALGGLDIPVIPLWVLWGNERFRDGVDITPTAFYRRLQESKDFPTTSQPSAGEFIDFFRRVAGEHGADAIVGVFVTSKISGTFASAKTALEQLPELAMRVVDSLSTSMGQGFMALSAARAAATGKLLDEVVAAAQGMRDKVHLLFVVDTLDYLHRGGRIGGAKWLMGTALKIKPLLHMLDGTVEPLVQVRTKRKAIARMLDVIEERLGGKQMAEASVIDADNPVEADAIAERVKERFGISTVSRTSVSPVIGTHAGPGTIGIAFYAV